MAHKTKFLAAAAVAALPSTLLAEGLERNNLDANFSLRRKRGRIEYCQCFSNFASHLTGLKLDNVAGGFKL